ncbi:hypothetical protein JNUCC0626_48350 [Lentzea sp. JNUCC 0626]|uniref:hypothetical protein n=1 Tax=Lentzea sp. JNUCC 0626 TaxID=3367513 RepID=UPI003749D73D
MSALPNLLDLIEAATGGTLAMERFVHGELAVLRELATPGTPASGWDGTVEFADPPEAELRDSDRSTWTLAVGREFEEAARHAADVVALIDALREQAGVRRGTRLTRGVADGAEDVWAPVRGTF